MTNHFLCICLSALGYLLKNIFISLLLFSQFHWQLTLWISIRFYPNSCSFMTKKNAVNFLKSPHNFFSAQPSIIWLLFHISQDFIGQIWRMSKLANNIKDQWIFNLRFFPLYCSTWILALYQMLIQNVSLACELTIEILSKETQTFKTFFFSSVLPIWTFGIIDKTQQTIYM